MLSQESLIGVGAIIEAHEAGLTERVAQAEHVRTQLADAKVAVGQAETAIKTAEQKLDRAQKQVRTYESEEQRAESRLEATAKNVAIDIAGNPDLDPVTKTLFSLVYEDRSLAWQETPDAYKTTAERGRVALSSVIEHLQPGEPVLYFNFARGNVVAYVATEKSLVATPPNVNKQSETYTSLEGGSIAVVMTDAPNTQATDQELVRIERKTEEATLISSYYENDVDRLEVAASNEQWLVIGREAITAKLERLDPVKRLVALTALRAAEVEVPVEVTAEIRKQTEGKLVSLIAFLAAGTGQETTTRSVRSRNAWTGGSHRSQITEDTPLTRMAKSVDKQSIRYMAQAIGLSKDVLREKVEAVLKSRVGKDTTSLDQLAKDIQSLATVDQILDTVF
jgi:hypothetical protein